MFYSHQLLARKAPLGQIWMAATMHAKINRKSLNKLNIIKICEEILNPSIPMALRLSGILMGGVVIVYERKVKLLYDDVTRLLVEINEAWKVKAAQDPIVLPKGKLQAKRETVTLPENKDKDVGEMEQSVNISNLTTTMGYQQTGFFAVRLDDVDEPDVDNNPRNEDPFQHYHQAAAENITLLEKIDSYQGNMEFYNRFERFDIEGDEETQMNNSGVPTQIPATLVPSPPHHTTNGPKIDPIADQVQEQYPEHQGNQQYDECKEAKQHEYQPRPKRARRKRQPAFIMDDEQTMIPGHIYRSWFQNTIDIISRRGKKRKARKTVMASMKIPKLMDLPSVLLMDDVLRNGIQEIHYPAPLMELYMRSIQPHHDSPSAGNSAAAPPDPSSVSPDDGFNSSDPIRYPFEYFQAGMGSPPVDAPMEKIRTAQVNDTVGILIDELKASRVAHGSSARDANVITTPGNSEGEMKSAGSTPDRERSNKKRPYSSSKHSGSSLDPVAEEYAIQHPDPAFRLSRLSEKDQNTEQEMLVETGPTPTQYPVVIQPVDKMTDTIRRHMKTHFETPGAPLVESLNHLADGMNRKGAALLFYQVCVLSTHDFLKVQQKMAYGDILISKGQKM